MIRTLLAIVLLGCSTGAWALANPLAEGLRHCATETDQGKRLACFDALTASLPKVEEDQVGLTADIVHKRNPEAVATPAVLHATIVDVKQSARGESIFTLDNQQVWVESQINPRVQFVAGDAVQIEHGAMGSIWLAGDKARKIRIRRLK